MFVTCTPKGPVKEHPEDAAVLETGHRGTVLTNQNNPVKVAKVLEQAHELLAGDKSPNDTTKMKPNEPFLRQALGVSTLGDNK